MKAGQPHNAANQVVGWSYDAAGNLLNDSTTTYGYDALDRLVTQDATTNRYNGDGVLVQRTRGVGTWTYAQDLVTPLEQMLTVTYNGDATNYLYGHERLRAVKPGAPGSWYHTDALGSVRQTLDSAGAVQATASYAPFGEPQGSSIAPFGFTGELQDQGLVNLRARWYDPRAGVFTGVDPFAGMPTYPDSLHPYIYAGNNPVVHTDPSGETWYMTTKEAMDLSLSMRQQTVVGSAATLLGVSAGFAGVAQALYPFVVGKDVAYSTAASAVTVPQLLGVPAVGIGFLAACQGYVDDRLNRIALLIDTANAAGSVLELKSINDDAKVSGVALMYRPGGFRGGTLFALNRTTGALFALELEVLTNTWFPESLYPHLVAFNRDDVLEGFHFDTILPVEVFFPKASAEPIRSVTLE